MQDIKSTGHARFQIMCSTHQQFVGIAEQLQSVIRSLTLPLLMVLYHRRFSDVYCGRAESYLLLVRMSQGARDSCLQVGNNETVALLPAVLADSKEGRA